MADNENMGLNQACTVLLVVVAILAIYHYYVNVVDNNKNDSSDETPAAENAEEGEEDKSQGEGMKNKNNSYEDIANKALGENREYFEVCNRDAEASLVADCMCKGDKFAYGEHDYGKEGMDYKEYVTSQAVSRDVVNNHQEFLKDRVPFGNKGSLFTSGRTYSPDSHESYDPTKWQGLYRPRYVPVCNPTQVTDTDYDLFKGNRQFCFKT